MNRISNQRGFTFVQLFFYILILIFLISVSINIVSVVSSMNSSNSAKVKFHAEKNQVYGYLTKHSKVINNDSIKSKTELVYEYNNERITFTLTDKGLEFTNGKTRQMFNTITNVDFTMINEVCYKDSSDTKCQKVDNVLQVVIKGESERKDKLYLNKSRRLFYVGAE